MLGSIANQTAFTLRPFTRQMHNMQNVTVSPARRSVYAQSKVSNRRKLLLGIDGRSATARRFRDIIMDLVHECGGEENLSTAELGLIRQAAAMTLQAEVLQTRIVLGNPVSADELVRLSSEARRVINSLSKRRKDRNVMLSPHLLALLRAWWTRNGCSMRSSRFALGGVAAAYAKSRLGLRSRVAYPYTARHADSKTSRVTVPDPTYANDQMWMPCDPLSCPCSRGRLPRFCFAVHRQ
jgi:hypothetical protein